MADREPLITERNGIDKESVRCRSREEEWLRRRYPIEEVEVEAGARTFRLLRPSDIDSLIAAAREEDELPFWAYLWPSSVGLAHRIMEKTAEEVAVLTRGGGEAGTLPPVRALEVGTGVGLVGMAAAALGWRVIQTDRVLAALRFARVNGHRNGFDLPGFAADWREFRLSTRFDVILASDILYEPALHPALRRLVENHLASDGRFLVGDPCREHALDFMAELEGSGWRVAVENAPSRLGDDTSVILYEARPPEGDAAERRKSGENGGNPGGWGRAGDRGGKA